MSSHPRSFFGLSLALLVGILWIFMGAPLLLVKGTFETQLTFWIVSTALALAAGVYLFIDPIQRAVRRLRGIPDDPC